jgi:hypothetical protein
MKRYLATTPYSHIACAGAVTALLSACTTATPIKTGDGAERYYVDCGRMSMSQCIAKANEVCPKGYTVDDQKQRTGWGFSQYGGGSRTESSMQVTCK